MTEMRRNSFKFFHIFLLTVQEHAVEKDRGFELSKFCPILSTPSV